MRPVPMVPRSPACRRDWCREQTALRCTAGRRSRRHRRSARCSGDPATQRIAIPGQSAHDTPCRRPVRRPAPSAPPCGSNAGRSPRIPMPFRRGPGRTRCGNCPALVPSGMQWSASASGDHSVSEVPVTGDSLGQVSTRLVNVSVYWSLRQSGSPRHNSAAWTGGRGPSPRLSCACTLRVCVAPCTGLRARRANGSRFREPPATATGHRDRHADCRTDDGHDIHPLEITEGVFEHRGGQTVLAMLDRLHAAGVRLVVDDFGTGYSSPSRLNSLPFDKVEIDKSFIDQLAGREPAHGRRNHRDGPQSRAQGRPPKVLKPWTRSLPTDAPP